MKSRSIGILLLITIILCELSSGQSVGEKTVELVSMKENHIYSFKLQRKAEKYFSFELQGLDGQIILDVTTTHKYSYCILNEQLQCKTDLIRIKRR